MIHLLVPIGNGFQTNTVPTIHTHTQTAKALCYKSLLCRRASEDKGWRSPDAGIALPTERLFAYPCWQCGTWYSVRARRRPSRHLLWRHSTLIVWSIRRILPKIAWPTLKSRGLKSYGRGGWAKETAEFHDVYNKKFPTNIVRPVFGCVQVVPSPPPSPPGRSSRSVVPSQRDLSTRLYASASTVHKLARAPSSPPGRKAGPLR